jgi:hypothetical protein
MGGPGSGRRTGRRTPGGRFAPRVSDPVRNLPVGDEGGRSRVSLEPWLARCLAVGEDDTAAAIVTELAGRTWQGTNPYA